MVNRTVSWLGPFALGVAAMYLLDPDRGARRRALLRDKAVWASRKTRDGAAALGCDLQNRAIGAAAEVRGLLDRRPASDSVIEARVRAELGRVCSHPGAIMTLATDGRLALSGAILASEHDQVMRAVRAVRGVTDVIDELEVHETAERIPSLQGGSLRPGQMWIRGAWSPTTQLAAAMAGVAAVAYLSSQRAH